MQISFSFSTSGFRWKRNKSELTNQTKRQPRRPAVSDYREYPTVNAELTQGLYHNSFPGLKLAGSMAYSPIAIPVSFMGLPIPVVEDDDEMQEVVDDMVKNFSQAMQSIHTQSHREGTIWIWPSYDSVERRLRWEFIPDESVSDIIVDINTRKIVKIITDEEIMITTDYNETENIRRRREFTAQEVKVRWTGGIRNIPENKNYRNPVGIIPIPFANNKDGEGHRGYSDYERIIPDLKDYADIDLAQSTMLAKFKVKQVQYFSGSVDEWLANNGRDEIDDVDIANTDFVMNKYDAEKTEYLYPQRAHEAWEEGLKRKFIKIVEGSGLPELLWGSNIRGNQASPEQQMTTFVLFVKRKQGQHTNNYYKLFESSFRLLFAAGEISRVPELEVKWNELSALSEKVKAEIFGLFAKGISDLVNVAGVTKEQLHYLWNEMYPEATENDIDMFKKQLTAMAGHKQFKDAPWMETSVLTGEDVEDEEPNPLDIDTE